MLYVYIRFAPTIKDCSSELASKISLALNEERMLLQIELNKKQTEQLTRVRSSVSVNNQNEL